MYFASPYVSAPAAPHRMGDVDFSNGPNQIKTLPGGKAGAVQTMKYMRDFANAAVVNPDQIIRGRALSLLGDLPPRKYVDEIKALHGFVRDNIRYVRDPDGVELVQSPEKTLEVGQGDCDDKATLLGALLKTVGAPARFVAVGFSGGPLSHVMVQARTRNTGDDRQDWMNLETIIPKPAGWFPSGVTSYYILKV